MGSIQVLKKPDWVAWDTIHEVVYKAHELNIRNGIVMRNPMLSGESIEEKLGKEGVMLVAMDGRDVVGTAALIPRTGNGWYNKGQYAYMCFDAVLPQYGGAGIYRRLCMEREKLALSMGIDRLYIDTHLKNKRTIDIDIKSGFKKVAVKLCGDHINVVLFKWISGCPYSSMFCTLNYYMSLIRINMYRLKRLLFHT